MSQQKHPVHGYHLKDGAGRMSTQEIVRTQLADMGQEDKFKKTYENIHKALATEKYRMIRNGDTLFLYEILQPGECHVQMINADSPKNMLRNIAEMVRGLGHAGFKQIHFDTENPQIVAGVKNLGINVQQDNPGSNQYTAVVTQ